MNMYTEPNPALSEITKIDDDIAALVSRRNSLLRQFRLNCLHLRVVEFASVPPGDVFALNAVQKKRGGIAATKFLITGAPLIQKGELWNKPVTLTNSILFAKDGRYALWDKVTETSPVAAQKRTKN